MNTNSYWKKWTLACGAGEFIGIGMAAGIAILYNHLAGEPRSLPEKFSNLLIMMLAGALEGLILASFQWRILQEKIPKLPAWQWKLATTFIAVSGWCLGMIFPLFIMEAPDRPVVFDPPLVLIAFISLGGGFVLGGLFGLVQWFVLRKYVSNSSSWILSNAVGWSIGLLWIDIAATWPDTTTPGYLILLSGVIGGILAGLSVGGVTGWVLKKWVNSTLT